MFINTASLSSNIWASRLLDFADKISINTSTFYLMAVSLRSACGQPAPWREKEEETFIQTCPSPSLSSWKPHSALWCLRYVAKWSAAARMLTSCWRVEGSKPPPFCLSLVGEQNQCLVFERKCLAMGNCSCFDWFIHFIEEILQYLIEQILQYLTEQILQYASLEVSYCSCNPKTHQLHSSVTAKTIQMIDIGAEPMEVM